jgi:outer membrane protein insertion porin family
MKHRKPSILFLMITLLFISACNTVKYLKPGEQLYTGATITVQSKDLVNKVQIKKEMEKVMKPKPNQTILGIRFKLWFYYIGGAKPKGIKKWIRKNFGEKPVLFDPIIPGTVTDLMTNRLNNLGYFDASAKYKTNSKKNKVTLSYTVTVSKPYTIDSISFPKGQDTIHATIKHSQKKTLIKQGMQYDLELLKAERTRIDVYMKNHGFYYFNPDYLWFKADSSVGKKTVNLKLALKTDVPAKAKVQYFIHNIYINPDYQLKDSIRKSIADTVQMDGGYYYLNGDSMFHPNVIVSSIFLKKGDKYSRKKYTATVSHLTGLNVFRYVNVKYADTIINGEGRLDVFINMSPTQRRSLQLEVEAVTKSNNYTGPALTASYKNRNLFHGAELLVVNLNTSYETQFTGIQKGFNSYEVGGSTQLFLPKFVTPFGIGRKIPTTYLPRTKIELGFRNLNRVLYFNMNAANLSYGYTWKQNTRVEHEFNPISINFAKLENTTKAFDDLLAENPFLKKSFEEQFTLGGNYSFTYNSLVNNPRRNLFYFNGMIDLSGNLVDLVQSLATGTKSTPDDPHKLFGYVYSQYTKLSADLRYHFVINKNSKIATRIIAGAGLPYGNSTSMPYIKQFFSGGSNSIRAFLPRTVGPGTYRKPDSLFSKTFLDEGGDIKLEGNVEYRFTIISVLKGALFLDAGNIWLYNKSDQLPGGEFHFNTFYKQLAVGTGFGFRVDVSYFVLRFDLGMPLRKPYITEHKGWVINQINFGDPTWRSQNIVLNIAIGYPF